MFLVYINYHRFCYIYINVKCFLKLLNIVNYNQYSIKFAWTCNCILTINIDLNKTKYNLHINLDISNSISPLLRKEETVKSCRFFRMKEQKGDFCWILRPLTFVTKIHFYFWLGTGKKSKKLSCSVKQRSKNREI